MAEPLELSVQATPNPNAIKVTLNRVLAAHGTTYREHSTADAGWAQRLLEIPGVTQLFVLNDFISITKQPGSDWNDLGPRIEQVLRETLT